MKNKLRLISPLPPSVNNYLHYRVASRGKKKYVEAYPSEETSAFKAFFVDYTKEQIKKQNWICPDKGKLVYVKMTFYLDRKRKDPNNLLKVPFDALTEAGVYTDDDIALPIISRVYIDKFNPRIVIEVYESNFIGVFNDKDDMNDFIKHNCDLCKKDRNKCRIFKDLLDNRINKDADGKICLKIKRKDM